MANVEFKDMAELNRAIENLARVSKKELREIIPAQARLFSTDLAANTRPFGNTAAGQKEGMAKVASRIGEIYKPIGWAVNQLKAKDEKLAKAFERFIRQKNYTAAANLFMDRIGTKARFKVGPFDDGKLHKAQSERKKVNECLIVIGSYRPVEAYIRETSKKVGFAKGGFATAARELGGVRGIPGYATRQNSPGRGVIQEGGNSLTVTVENNVNYIEEAYDKSSEARAIEFRRKQINSVISRIEGRMKGASTHVK